MTWASDINHSARVRSRIHRILRRMKRFRMLSSLDIQALENRFPTPVTTLGVIIGHYRNDRSNSEETRDIYFAEAGMFWQSNAGIKILHFADISRATYGSAGIATDKLFLTLDSGEVIEMPVRGRDNHFNDAMEMLRFLARASEDCRS
jgi:hypothetical protein